MRRQTVTAGALALGFALAGGSHVTVAPAQSTSDLEQTIGSKRAAERSARRAASKLGLLEQRLAREVAIVQRKLDVVEASYRQAESELAQTRNDLASERLRKERLRERLAEGQRTLAAQLKRSYMTTRPDITTIVLNARGVSDLLDQLDFERRVQNANSNVLEIVRGAKLDARAEAARLSRLERRRARVATGIRRQRAGMTEIRSALAGRQTQLAQAKAARLAAASSAKSGRLRAQRTLRKLEKEREQFVGDTRGPGGPWAIPWAIVQCESGGQNLPPNSAGASGYYQFMPQTWRGLGGSTPNAYQASKAEQDRLAATLWRGGAGRGNWVCAALVGA